MILVRSQLIILCIRSTLRGRGLYVLRSIYWLYMERLKNINKFDEFFLQYYAAYSRKHSSPFFVLIKITMITPAEEDGRGN